MCENRTWFAENHALSGNLKNPQVGKECPRRKVDGKGHLEQRRAARVRAACGVTIIMGTPWKMNGWNLQPSPIKRKEKGSEPNPYDYVPY